jgi:polyisoprenoid-binding protein YceI
MNKMNIAAVAAILSLAACGSTENAENANNAPSTTPVEDVTPPVTQIADGEYTINADASEIVWVGRKLPMGEHKGNISFSSGNLRITEGAIAGGMLTVDMASMTCTDLSEEKGSDLVGHLQSDDFFSTATHATATFQIESFTANEMGGIAKGTMTIKGISQPQAIELTMNSTEAGLEIRGMMKVDRTLYDIKYQSGIIGEGLDWVIEDNFELGFFVVANA